MGKFDDKSEVSDATLWTCGARTFFPLVNNSLLKRKDDGCPPKIISATWLPDANIVVVKNRRQKLILKIIFNKLFMFNFGQKKKQIELSK